MTADPSLRALVEQLKRERDEQHSIACDAIQWAQFWKKRVEQLKQIELEMTQALSVGEFFNPSLRFRDGGGAVLSWRDRITALLSVSDGQQAEKS